MFVCSTSFEECFISVRSEEYVTTIQWNPQYNYMLNLYGLQRTLAKYVINVRSIQNFPLLSTSLHPGPLIFVSEHLNNNDCSLIECQYMIMHTEDTQHWRAQCKQAVVTRFIPNGSSQSRSHSSIVVPYMHLIYHELERPCIVFILYSFWVCNFEENPPPPSKHTS